MDDEGDEWGVVADKCKWQSSNECNEDSSLNEEAMEEDGDKEGGEIEWWWSWLEALYWEWIMAGAILIGSFFVIRIRFNELEGDGEDFIFLGMDWLSINILTSSFLFFEGDILQI